MLTPDAGGFCGTLRVKQFSGFEFFLLPSRDHARPSAMLCERKPLGSHTRQKNLMWIILIFGNPIKHQG
jgi:hypothetical protein